MRSDSSEARSEIVNLLDEMANTSGRTGVVLVLAAPEVIDDRALTLSVDADGTLATPWCSLRANRLTAEEAITLGRLFDDADVEGDEPTPDEEVADGTAVDRDVAGSLARDLTVPRTGTGDPESVLPRPDRVYVESAATTDEDLAALAPVVPASDRSAGRGGRSDARR